MRWVEQSVVRLGEMETMWNITIENKRMKQQRIKMLHPGPAVGFQLVTIQLDKDEWGIMS